MEKGEWLNRYQARMTERGLNEKEAKEVTDAISGDPDFLDDDPEQAADDELSYWTSDC